jgi:hypothetical protein
LRYAKLGVRFNDYFISRVSRLSRIDFFGSYNAFCGLVLPKWLTVAWGLGVLSRVFTVGF